MFCLIIALAVFARSLAAYEALKSFKILQWPARSTLQAYTGAFLHEPGANSACIEDQVAQYVRHCQQRLREGKKESMDGVMIFDEVKVVSRLMWNSRNHKLIGLSMNSDDQASLGDIYQSLLDGNSVQQTSYILQFLWRDLTSDFDIVGPYFTYSKTTESKFVLSCVYESIKLFYMYGLNTSLIVCDGASTNLVVIKATHGHSGVYNKCVPLCLLLLSYMYL